MDKKQESWLKKKIHKENVCIQAAGKVWGWSVAVRLTPFLNNSGNYASGYASRL